VMLSMYHPPIIAAWLLMLGAMMLPMQTAQIRLIAFKSEPSTRQISVLLFVLGYFLVWSSIALLFVIDHNLAHPNKYAACMAFVFAAVWTQTSIFQSNLWKSHASRAVYTKGWRRIQSTFGHGVRVSGACVITCAPAMLACAWSHHYLPAMLLGFIATYLLKAYERPPIRKVAYLYLICAVLTWP